MGEVILFFPSFPCVNSLPFCFVCVHLLSGFSLLFQAVQKKKKNENEKNGDGGGGGGKKKEEIPFTVVLKIDMHCEGCANKITKCVKGFEGMMTMAMVDFFIPLFFFPLSL